MRNTKLKIIECSIELFTSKGYENVSLREIAKSAGTTIGNLTYHFSKKETLLLDILEDFHSTFLEDFMSEGTGLGLLKNTIFTFQKANENQVNHQFYFCNLYEITKESERIKNINLKFQDKLMNNYYSRWILLKKDGIIDKDIDDEVLRTISRTIVILITVWGQNNLLVSENKNQHNLSVHLCDLLKTLIDKKYILQFEQICNEIIK